jgi:hypothetical protein
MAKIYEIELESMSPMLHHGSQALGMEEQEMKKKGGSALIGDTEEWKKTVYFDEKIGVYLPASNVEAALIEAAKQFKISGRATATKFFKSGVFIMDDTLPLLVNGNRITDINNIEVDKRTVKNPSTKGRNVRYRAIFRQWQTKFRIMISSDDYIKEDLLKQTFEYAGLYVGLCDYRPRFGRFVLKSLKAVK